MKPPSWPHDVAGPDAVFALRQWWPALIAAALAVIAYLNAVHNPFVYDDYRVVVTNRSIVPPLHLSALLFQDASRPAVNISYALDRALWGPSPFGFHLTSVLLHALNVVLVFALVRAYRARVSRWRVVGTTSALLFAVHPLLTQAVGYVSARSEVLCATWFLLCLLCLERAASGPARWLALATGCWLMAAASREVGAMLSVVGLIAHRWVVVPASNDSERRTSRWLSIMLVVGAVVVTARMAVFVALENTHPVRPDWEMALVEADVTRQYLQMLVLPGRQTVFHAVAPITGVRSARLLIDAALIVSWLAAARVLRSRAPLASLGGAWFLLLLLPSAVLAVLGRGDAMAEHRVYLASVGVFMMAGVGIERADAWLDSRAAVTRWTWRVSLLALLVLLGARTVLRNAIWGDPVVLWTEAVAAAPDQWLPHIALGESLHLAGRHNEAIGAFAMAALRRPLEPTARRKLGVCLVEVGDLSTAATTFDELQRLWPTSWEGPSGLAMVALARGDVESARAYADQVRQRGHADDEARQVVEALDAAIAGAAR